MSIDYKKILSQHYDLEPVVFNEQTIMWRDETPAHSFTSIFTPTPDGAHFLLLVARDYYDESLAQAIFEFILNRLEKVQFGIPSQILEGFHHETYGFDSVMSLGPECHGMLDYVSPELHRVTLQVYPIFRCEFLGDEKPDLIQMIRHDFVSTLDWKRSASPRIEARYSNTKTGERSTGKKFGLTSQESLRRIVDELTSAEGSFVELRNYKGHTCRLVIVQDTFQAQVSGISAPVELSAKEIHSWIETFLKEGFG